jgi:hypothetical protein
VALVERLAQIMALLVEIRHSVPGRVSFWQRAVLAGLLIPLRVVRALVDWAATAALLVVDWAILRRTAMLVSMVLLSRLRRLFLEMAGLGQSELVAGYLVARRVLARLAVCMVLVVLADWFCRAARRLRVALAQTDFWLSGSSHKVSAESELPIPDISVFRRQIEEALAHSRNTYSYDDVVRMVQNKEAQYWPGKESVAITQILDYPQKRVLHFFIAGGNMAEIEACEPLICQWGKEQGCVTATLTGRRGWERTYMARTGWTPTLYTMEKTL